MVATIQAFGSNKDGLNVFQVQPFQQKTLNNLSKGRSLVIMGYSGSDDFDVVPTLMVLKSIKHIVWINYIPDDKGKEKIYEINATMTDTTDKVNQILVNIKKTNNAEHVYRVDTNTTRLIKMLLDVGHNVSTEIFSSSPPEWLELNLPMPSALMEYSIPNKIYFDFNIYEDSMRCSKVLLRLAEKGGKRGWKSIALDYIGRIYHAQGNYPEALKRYEEALKIVEQLGDLSGKSHHLSNIGMIYKAQGNYPEALKRYEEALKIAEQLGDLSGKSHHLNNIGMIYEAQGNYPEALKRYEEALKIAEQLGNLSGKASALNNIGMIYDAQENYPEALKTYEEALKIDEQLGNLSGKSIVLNNIGSIYQHQGNYLKALKHFEIGLKTLIEIGLGDSPDAKTFKKDIEVLKSKMKQ